MSASAALSTGLLEATRLWTPRGLRAVERLEAGDELFSLNPHSFQRVTSRVERVIPREAPDGWELLAGGRLLVVAPGHLFPVWELSGTWRVEPIEALRPGMWLAVDRKVPSPPGSLAFPDLDPLLSARMSEDPVAIADALFSQDSYHAEMGKRTLRLQLFELSGYILADGELLGDAFVLAEGDPRLLSYYRAILRKTFGEPTSPAELTDRLRRWMGEGLLPSHARGLPAWAWELENGARAALLRGYFDAASQVSPREVRATSPSRKLVTSLQSLLGTLGIEATIEISADKEFAAPCYHLHIRNVRRFAEWIHSTVPDKAALLKEVYGREPRYPSDGAASLPLDRARAALETLRATHNPPRPAGATAAAPDERDLASVSTLRLLAAAYPGGELSQLLGQQLFLEPVQATRLVPGGIAFHLELTPPHTCIASGIVSGKVGKAPGTPES